ncbi:hypothetical protein [Bradyrhizobium sp. 170]|uniref:hypothetical protein n=1 Tax=Bradyrhizobium sp. 170 TaxID=2782641 RepID=UPI001FFF9007|nr:hypothetical protein [Bradyrhizobium sp. 170]UPK02834.1 hypothetical protein IVB05_35590 [Bradyrhizobium sp. 170]
MIKAKDAVVWINNASHGVLVLPQGERPPEGNGRWSDPIGASYRQWQEMENRERVLLMLETAIDLSMQDFDLGSVLREMARVKEFRALGSESSPMCRALTKALTGKTLDSVTMTFEELLVTYGRN